MGKRIAIFVPGINIYGQEKALLLIAKYLSSKHDVIIFGHNKWGNYIEEYCVRNNLKFHPIIFGSIWSYSLFIRQPKTLLTNIAAFLLTNFYVYKVHKKNNIDIILTGNSIFTFYALIVIKLCKIKLVFRAGDELPRHNLINKIISLLIIKSSNVIFCNCYFLKNKINKLYDVESSVIRNFVDSSNTKLNKKFSEINNLTSVIFVGQITKEKGLHLLLKSIYEILNNRDDIFFYIIGSEPGYKINKPGFITYSIAELVDKYPNNLCYEQFTSNVTEFYKKSDIHICPSVYDEPSANVIFEAKSHGLPSIIFKVGGLEELVRDNIDGLCSSEISSDQLTKMIILLVDNKELRHSLSVNAINSLESNFNNNEIKKSFDKIIC